MVKPGVHIIAWTLFCSCVALTPDIHKLMSPAQLQSVFQVSSHDLVPTYELITLSHHGSHHHVRRRDTSANRLPVDDAAADKLEVHFNHKKKDLSKSAYYSAAKQSAQNHTSSPVFQFVSDSSVRSPAPDGPGRKQFDVRLLAEHNVSLSAFGEVYNLTLRPTDGLFKDGPHNLRMWTVTSEPNATHGLEYTPVLEDTDSNRRPGATEHVGEVFQDQHNMAAILMRKHATTDELLMDGSIGHELVIRPMPTDFRTPRSAADGNGGAHHHVVFKRVTSDISEDSDFAYMEPDRLIKRYRRRRAANVTHGSRTKRAVPHIIYPEILVIVDYDGYRLHGGDNVQVKRYFVSFWNGVDLRYRLLKGPRIRISIAGIIISRGRDATPYLERNRVGRDAIDSAAALTDMGKYLFRERRLPVYDIAVAITKYDMCRRRKGGRCTKGTADLICVDETIRQTFAIVVPQRISVEDLSGDGGFAYVGGACVVNKRLEKVNSVAIIEDTGGFSGIIVAAHEVGHLLGAVHDGSPPPSYLGGPGAEKCRWEDGFIMSDLRHTERGFRWSPCTIQSFHHFLNGDTASCLHNAPHEDEALGRALPGTLLSLDAQCRRDRGTSACFKDERVCAQLFCFDAASGYCVAYRPAAEGSMCGDGSHCLDGRCVAEHENIIPDYSQHTPSYANPNAYGSQLNTEAYIYNEDDEPQPSSTTTTRRTTTTRTTTRRTTTTTTTTTPKPDYSLYYATSTDYPYSFYTPDDEVVVTPSSTTYNYNAFYAYTSTTTKKPVRTISPFYYGLNYNDKTKSTTTTRFPPYRPFSTSTTTTPRPTTTKRTTTKSAGGSASSKPTRNPVFDVYLNRLAAATKSPYNFDNFAQYFRTSTPKPRYSYNLVGANSHAVPVSETSAGSAAAASVRRSSWAAAVLAT